MERLKQEVDVCKAKRGAVRSEMKTQQDGKAQAAARLDTKKAEQKVSESKHAAADEGDEEIIDEEEFHMRQNIQVCKKAIKKLSQAYREADEDYRHVKSQLKTAEAALVQAFATWFTEKQAEAGTALNEDGDVLDDGEQFDKLEIERVMAEDPESVAFFKATKAQKERSRRAPAAQRSRKRG